MEREDFVDYLKAVGLDLEELAELDAADRGGALHAPEDRARLWRVVNCASSEACLTDADARWLAASVDWMSTSVADSVTEFIRQRDADARDLAYQTRVDPLPKCVARPSRGRTAR